MIDRRAEILTSGYLQSMGNVGVFYSASHREENK
jgi:hypothetical protein